MIDEIENQIFNMEEKEVPTSAIGELVMGKLKDLDEVAYVRFASVYREFKDVNTFIDEIGKLLKNRIAKIDWKEYYKYAGNVLSPPLRGFNLCDTL